MSAHYGRLDRQESEDSRNPNPRRTVQEKLQDKLEAFVWVVVAALVGYYSWGKILRSNSSNETENDESDSKRQANSMLLQIGFILIGLNILLLLYLTVYLPRCKGLTDSSAWPVYCPRVVPSMVVLGITSFFVLIRATWPVWGFLAPLFLAVQVFGLFFALQFVPWPF